jgi:hypothetical protein
MKKIIVSAFILAICSGFRWQSKIFTEFTNPSFEHSELRESVFPTGWSSRTADCTPDILPGAWHIKFAPHAGRTCVGLVTRETGSTEDLGQQLPKVLEAGGCYKFSMYLAHAPKYVGYDRPVRVRVWGGQSPGHKQVLLATSALVSHTEWRAYDFQFEVSQTMPCLTFEAYYAPGVSFKYRGNVLLDACSAIERCVKA